MPKARRTSYNLALTLEIVAEAEAVENNSEIAREYGISESVVCRWRKDQANLFNLNTSGFSRVSMRWKKFFFKNFRLEAETPFRAQILIHFSFNLCKNRPACSRINTVNKASN